MDLLTSESATSAAGHPPESSLGSIFRAMPSAKDAYRIQRYVLRQSLALRSALQLLARSWAFAVSASVIRIDCGQELLDRGEPDPRNRRPANRGTRSGTREGRKRSLNDPGMLQQGRHHVRRRRHLQARSVERRRTEEEWPAVATQAG